MTSAIVIASQRVWSLAGPMTGSAKQSISPRKEGMDCFVALLLAMTAYHHPHSASTAFLNAWYSAFRSTR